MSRRNPTARAQAQSEKAEQEASASAEGAPAAEQKGKLDNVPSPLQEQLSNQKVCAAASQNQTGLPETYQS